MAPVDRREHRQQRIRGAGATAVQTNFGFSFGALAAPAKQTSLPPQPSPRRTPIRNTPRNANGSAQRHRSASLLGSSAKKQQTPSIPPNVTPQLGKRKRGSRDAVDITRTEADIDELSPARVENVHSSEKSRRVVRSVSVIREDDAEADELSYIENVEPAIVPPGVNEVNKTPTALLPSITQTPSLSARNRPVDSVRVASLSSKAASTRKEPPESITSTRRKNTPSEPPPATPAGATDRNVAENSALATPIVVPSVDESEDELTPVQLKPVSIQRLVGDSPQTPAGGVASSSPVPARTQTQRRSRLSQTVSITPQRSNQTIERDPILEPTNNSASRLPLTEEEGDDSDVVQSTPATNNRRRIGIPSPGQEQTTGVDLADELSPDKTHPSRTSRTPTELSFAGSSAGSDDEPVDVPPVTRPQNKSRQPKPVEQGKRSADSEPPKKRQKSGPTQKITVMRLKGFGVKGLTVVDTTRTVVEDLINSRVAKISSKIERIKDAARQKEVRSQRNHVLAFREKLDDYFLDLQDANNSAIHNANKLKGFRRDKKQLQSEFMSIQKERSQLALKSDDITAEFQLEKMEFDNRTDLSSWMYDIQAAVQSGKDRARDQGREGDGPEIPLKMLLETVAHDVGSGSGLLSSIQNFNGVLERSAGYLESRA
ncbi:hypothetical protein BU24DRAFT_447149 [Aaosphaeria arxii CBS 175.79]|uniref:Inner kinetochore subunit AME1 domain-containing protein n=1 Tax=Aaosphaeria arxii CBS 175.79 TaxID=1450172 RepID=A0A6A5YCD7_9PLEO|nr:uncharacterized protein BU24DRAFT_447149 [Aaosphaeria arxii CBS 175.79]KAF2022360.1 hypothetical protein BU24DRAFT_447149 [Aaosphaeria arxii CBS 175.79]